MYYKRKSKVSHYKSCRLEAKITQEKAAEYFDISVRSLASYEGKDESANDQVVAKMVQVYGNEWLGWWHMKNKNPLGKVLLPDILKQEKRNINQSFIDAFVSIDIMIDDILNLKKMIRKHVYNLQNGKSETDEMLSDLVQFRSYLVELLGVVINIYLRIPKKQSGTK